MAYDDPRTDSLTGTIGKIVDDVRELFREEVALARAEFRQEIGEGLLGRSRGDFEQARGNVVGHTSNDTGPRPFRSRNS